MNTASTSSPRISDPITIKKYANRRLYNTATSTYVTLEDLCQMVKQGEEFNVYDAKTGDDITRSVLTQIIVEEESKGGQNLLPIGFLRQLISFYGGNLQMVLPKYLEQSLQMFTANRDQWHSYMKEAVGKSFNPMLPLAALEEVSRQNLSMFEQTMKQALDFFASFDGKMPGAGKMPGMPASMVPPGMVPPGMMPPGMFNPMNMMANAAGHSSQTPQSGPQPVPTPTPEVKQRVKLDDLKQRLADMQREVDALKSHE